MTPSERHFKLKLKKLFTHVKRMPSGFPDFMVSYKGIAIFVEFKQRNCVYSNPYIFLNNTQRQFFKFYPCILAVLDKSRKYKYYTESNLEAVTYVTKELNEKGYL